MCEERRAAYGWQELLLQSRPSSDASVQGSRGGDALLGSQSSRLPHLAYSHRSVRHHQDRQLKQSAAAISATAHQPP